MSLKPDPIQPVPEETARVARAAFRKGNPLSSCATSSAPSSPTPTSPTCSPSSASRACRRGGWRWSPCCSSARTCPTGRPPRRCAPGSTGSTCSASSWPTPASTTRCCASSARACWRAAPRSGCWASCSRPARRAGLLKARGRQRTDSTHVLASIRALNRLELVGETLRAALNELATVAPDWLRGVAPEDWYERYAHRVEDGRLPRAEAEREAYARTVGEDGFALLDRLGPAGGARGAAPAAGGRGAAAGLGAPVRARGRGRPRAAACAGVGKDEPQPAGEPVESPYDPRRATAPARAPPGPATSST